MTDKERFMKFLENNNAKEKFEKNFKKDGGYYARNNIYWLLLSAFEWEKTEEGFGYWHDLHRLWRKDLRGGVEHDL